MAKEKLVYVCEQCGQDSPKWVGKCPSCGAWNSFKQLHVSPSSAANAAPAGISLPETSTVKPLRQVATRPEPRIDTGDTELNRVLGGGIVPGSLILLGGEPGIGKSTLILQTVMRLPLRILYVSGEESRRLAVSREMRRFADEVIAIQPTAEFNRHVIAGTPGVPYDLMVHLIG